MNRILIVESSPRGAESARRKLTTRGCESGLRCNIQRATLLGFIGIDDVQTVRAEGMNIPPLAIHAVSNGEKAVEALAI